jgi:hypothetical protein
MNDIEKKASQPESGSHGVQLGFGTLIIIALIVTMCSGRSEMEKVQKDTAELKQKLGVIEKKLDALAENGGVITFKNASTPTAPVGVEAAASKSR